MQDKKPLGQGVDAMTGIRSKLDDIEIEGVDPSDYPDFCDAFISSATWKDTGEDLTDDELGYLMDKCPDLAHELATESFQ